MKDNLYSSLNFKAEVTPPPGTLGKTLLAWESTKTKREFVRSLWANDVPNSQTPINSHYTPFGEK